MTNSRLLIFDLDDTIFETRSIAKHHVDPILNDFKVNIRSYFGNEEIDLIISDLWKYPFDYVSEKYNLENSIQLQFSNSVKSIDYRLEIETFSDFELVRKIEMDKVLVTTGFKKLQLAKISALKLEDVFKEIHIDEIDSTDRIHKKGIFKQLIKSRKSGGLKNFFIIGDNPNSELKAGFELGLTTIQVAKHGQPKSSYADYYIKNFGDLLPILLNSERA